jgi:hypothetical protein
MFTRPDTPTTAVPVITAAGIAVGVAGKAERPARGKKPRHGPSLEPYVTTRRRFLD